MFLVFDAAFQEPDLLQCARSFRNRSVWVALRDQDAKRRRVEGFLQRAPGVRCYWEDVLVDFLGLHWRAVRSSSTWRDWKSQGEDFVRHTCGRWNLPLCAVHTNAEGSGESQAERQKTDGEPCKERLVFRGSTPEADEVMDTVAPLIEWSRPERCFVYVVDSQSLQNIVCGHARLQDSYYEPIITRIVDRLFDHLCCRWIPPKLWADLVKWMDRSHNKVADGLADLTMDVGRSWHKEFEFSREISRCNLVIQTDGGLREGNCAAAAYIIGIWEVGGQDGKFEPLVIHGSHLEATCTVFVAEAIALDEASAEAARIMRRYS